MQHPEIASPAAAGGERPRQTGSCRRTEDQPVQRSAPLLVVEDEPIVLILAQEMLEERGYAVLTAPGGMDAIRLLDVHADRIAGLVTDVRLGAGPTGWDVARHARRLRPELPVIYTSGDSGEQWPVEGVAKSMLVEKPYPASQMVAAVSALLAEASSSGPISTNSWG
jgi:CheY-like chemotaxis protein